MSELNRMDALLLLKFKKESLPFDFNYIFFFFFEQNKKGEAKQTSC